MADLILLAEAAHEAAEHHAEATAFGLAPPWWVALSMIALFGVMLYMKVPALVASMLDKKIAGIREMLDEAAKLRKEAEALKAEYEQKVASASKHAEELKAGAAEEARHIVEKAKADAAALVARREKMAEEKIAAAERAAVADLRNKAAEAAVVAARGLIRENHSADADKALVDEAISRI
jgi:F-type H+-transporting ATPase subunit b